MDIQKLLELLEHYPTWFKTGIALWVLISAFLVVGLLTLRQPHLESTVSTPPPFLPPKSKQEAVSSVPLPVVMPPLQETIKQSLLTLDDYAKQLRARSDRFMERQEFITQLSGSNVSWEGLVEKVDEGSGPSPSLSLTLKSLTAKPEMLALVGLPNSMRTKAFSLQRGDVVRVAGVLRLSTPNFPDVEGTELVVMKARTGG